MFEILIGVQRLISVPLQVLRIILHELFNPFCFGFCSSCAAIIVTSLNSIKKGNSHKLRDALDSSCLSEEILQGVFYCNNDETLN